MTHEMMIIQALCLAQIHQFTTLLARIWSMLFKSSWIKKRGLKNQCLFALRFIPSRIIIKKAPLLKRCFLKLNFKRDC